MRSDPVSNNRDVNIEQLTRQLGRPLRILHIGNIANNAYNNARIQRQYGIDADVLCHDYYHVMATPEWEDGGLATRVDPLLPNWWESNLKGFKRPEWYVQGPLPLCLEYLDAHRRDQPARRWRAAIALEDAYIDRLRDDATHKKRRWHDPRPFLARHHLIGAVLKRQYAGGMLSSRARGLRLKLSQMSLLTLRRIEIAPEKLAAASDLRNLVIWPLIAAALQKPPRIAFAWIVPRAYSAFRTTVGRSNRDNDTILEMAAALVPEGSTITWPQAMRRSTGIVARMVIDAALSPFAPAARAIANRIWDRSSIPEIEARKARAPDILARLIPSAPLAEMTPDDRADLNTYIGEYALMFGPILKHYDIVQGYSVDGFIPLVNDHPHFASYEHGTVRELPFENTLTGRICNIAYRNSPAVFITNTDVLPSVARLGLDPKAVHYLPHAFDDRKLMSWRDAHPELRPPSDGVVFFSPTRQHWRDVNPSLTKGNDIMLRAAGRLWQEGRRFSLILVEWGQDLGASRQLIDELGFTSAVQWVSPMGKQDLWRAYCTSHGVLDQFTLPALGGVGFETLTLGCRLITRTDQPTLANFFGAAPPVLAAGNIDDVVTSMRLVLDDPLDEGGIGAAGRAWIDAYHSARRTVGIQASVYRQLLGG